MMALHPYNKEKASAHTEECTKRHSKLQARLMSAEVECGICYDKVSPLFDLLTDVVMSCREIIKHPLY